MTGNLVKRCFVKLNCTPEIEAWRYWESSSSLKADAEAARTQKGNAMRWQEKANQNAETEKK